MKKGSITIYLSLIFSVLLAMLTVLLTGTRDSVIRMKTECSMDAALYSVFAEYNRELLDQYDLLFIDTSYGKGQGSPANLESRLKFYMNQNFQLNNHLGIERTKDLLALSAADVVITDYALATDDDGEVLARQAVDYIQQKYGLGSFARIQGYFQTAADHEFLTRDVSAEQSDNQSRINSMELPKRKISDEEWEEVPLDNPADLVNGARGLGTLSLVLNQDKELSTRAVNLSNYVTGRDCEKGSGVGSRARLSQAQKLLFNKYIIDKTNCYTSEDNEATLQYQLEYILAGKASDEENLKKVVERLLFIRQAANLTYLFSDATKVAEAEALALSLTAVAMAPEFAEPVKLSILLAWAYAESIYDIRHLMAGGTIPLLKTAETWHFSLSEMLQFRQYLPDETIDESLEEGMRYDEYLGMLLLEVQHDTKIKRMMDIIEMEVRKKDGNHGFRLDTCVDFLEAQIAVESGFGYGCSITRNYYYY